MAVGEGDDFISRQMDLDEDQAGEILGNVETIRISCVNA